MKELTTLVLRCLPYYWDVERVEHHDIFAETMAIRRRAFQILCIEHVSA